MAQPDTFIPTAMRSLARSPFNNYLPSGTSSSGKEVLVSFGASPCWFISLNEETDIASPAFKGIFLTERGGLGFLSRGQIARFNNGVAFIGRVESAHEGIDVNLVGLGLHARSQVAFILGDNYRNKFEVPEAILTELLKQLSESGALILSISETLSSREHMDVIWTLPAEHPDPNNPQVLEMRRPAS